jgi:ribosomal subunit interface protein
MKGVSGMDIIFKGRRTDVQERFRNYTSAKLSRITKLEHKAIRVDVEVTAERNPRQSGRRERVELTILSRGPAIRAEAAADDRFAAFDRALAKLEERLRRSGDRSKAARHGALQAGRPPPPPGRRPRRRPRPAPGPPARPGREATARNRPGGHRPARAMSCPGTVVWCPSRWRATAR